jgi:hypothetical protein
MANRLVEPGNILEAVYGSPSYLGTIVATTTKNNHDTATPFNNTGDALKTKMLMVQPDAECYILAGTTNGATVTTGNGVYLDANEKFFITMKSGQGWLACVSLAGTTNLKVWEMV